MPEDCPEEAQEAQEAEDAEEVPEAEEAPDAEEVEVVDALPVVAEVRELAAPAPVLAPIVQTAAAAATGFLAGAATLALMRRLGGRRLAREVRDLRAGLDSSRRGAGRDPWPLEPGRSYVVHVRVLSRPPAWTPPPPAASE